MHFMYVDSIVGGLADLYLESSQAKYNNRAFKTHLLTRVSRSRRTRYSLLLEAIFRFGILVVSLPKHLKDLKFWGVL